MAIDDTFIYVGILPFILSLSTGRARFDATLFFDSAAK